MKKILLMVLSILLVDVAGAQPSFIKKLPMRGEPAKMIATTDGGYACLAATDYVNFQFNKISLIKCDANGDTVWTQKYSLNDSSVYFPDELVEISNGLLILSRYKEYLSSEFKNVIYFLNSVGNVLTYHINDDPANIAFFSLKAVALSLDTVVVLGGPYPNMFLSLYDTSGSLLFINSVDTFAFPYQYTKLYSKLNIRAGFDLHITKVSTNLLKTSNVYVSDNAASHINDHFYSQVLGLYSDLNKIDNGLAYLSEKGDTITKLDSNLDSLWTHSVTNYYAPGFLSQLPTDFKATADGGYVMCGNISNSIAHMVFLLKTDSLANSQFRQVYFGAAVDNVVSVEQATDGGYVMFQSGNPDTTNVPEMWLVKTDSTGLLTHVKNEAVKQQGVDFKLSPNPATENVRVAFTKNATGKIMMLDLAGRVLYAANVKNKTTVNIPVAKFKNGLYAVLFTSTSSKPSVKKLIVNH